VAALIVLLLRTKSVSLLLSDSLSGRALRAYFSERALGLFPRNQFCQGVLMLPRDHDAYLRGRSRQALRTNLRHAASAGISCEEITDTMRALDHVLDIVDHRDGSVTEDLVNAWCGVVAEPELTLIVARDAHGRPLAIAGVIVDDMVCLVRFAVARDHAARWGLHDHLVQALIAGGVSYLVTGGGGPFGALGFEPNVQYYQHLLGYELRHVILGAPRVFERKRRVYVYAAMALASVTLTSAALLTMGVVAVAWNGVVPLILGAF
jgi:hypothetical protein